MNPQKEQTMKLTKIVSAQHPVYTSLVTKVVTKVVDLFDRSIGASKAACRKPTVEDLEESRV